jgi:hypothetical protein
MTLRSTDMKRLWGDSSSLHLRNHKGWLAEALNALTSTGDPNVAVELLQKMRRDVGSDHERRALDDVVRWLEKRLGMERTVTTARLLWELGWLRRMAVARIAEHRGVARDGHR